MTIAITGATGQLGRLVINTLKDKVLTNDIVALVRNPSKAQDLEVTVRKADYIQTNLLETALQNINTVLLISSNEIGQRTAQHSNIIRAAQKAGVKHIVYTSLLHADISPLNLAQEHKDTERKLKTSGLIYTILRNGWYTENYTASIPAALASGAFYGSAGDGKISSASREDYAIAAATILADKSTIHYNKTYELAGNEAYTLTEFAKELSKQTGKNIPYLNLPENQYANILLNAGLSKEFAMGLASWDIGASQGALFDDTYQLSKLLGQKTTSLAEMITATLKKL